MIEDSSGCRFWRENGQLHRLNGPAITRSDGTREWWVNGIRIPDNPTPQDILEMLLW